MSEHTPAAFISYSRDDSEFALRLAQDLKAAGASVWLDQLDIEPGLPWDNAIEDALIEAPQMLIVLSPASARSNNVRNEISFALEQGKIIVPVLYMDCIVPLRLQRTQRIDFRADYARGLASLLAHLRVIRPDPEVLQKAADGDAHREVAWKAREAQAQRLKDLADEQEATQRIAEETERKARESEELRLQAAADTAAREQREAEDRDLFNRSQAATLKEEQQKKEQQQKADQDAAALKQRQMQPPFIVAPKPPDPKPLEPLIQKTDRTPLILAAGAMSGIIVILVIVLAYVLLHSSKPSPDNPVATTSQPKAPAEAPVVVPQTTTSTEPVSNPFELQKPETVVPAQRTVAPSVNPFLKEVKPATGSTVSATDREALYQKGSTAYSNKSYADAARIFEQVCTLGGANGCGFLGYLYDNGLSFSKNQQKADTLYQKGCDGGDSWSCTNLGFAYDKGTGVVKDVQKANALYKKGCDGSIFSACKDLANNYSSGIGVPKDFEKAAALNQKACDGNDTGGCTNLGLLYDNGTGVPKDKQKAATLYQKACNTNVPTYGCEDLANLYLAGDGIPKDLSKAKALFTKSCSEGYQSSCDDLKKPELQ